MPAKFTKLRDGSWGISATSSVEVGDVVRVDRRDGSSKRVRVERVLSGRNGTWICAISDLDSAGRQSAAGFGRVSSSGSRKSDGVLEGTRTVRHGGGGSTVGSRAWVGSGADRRPMVVVGWSVEHVREDGLSFGYPDDEGTFTVTYYRDATEAESAEMLAERSAKEEAIRLEARRKADALKAAMDQARAPLAGMVRCTHVSPPLSAPHSEVGRYSTDDGLVIVQRYDWDGRVAYVETSSFFDDYRTYTWASADEIERLRVEYLSVHPDETPDTAVAWLQRVRGCHGTEFYEWLAARVETVPCAS